MRRPALPPPADVVVAVPAPKAVVAAALNSPASLASRTTCVQHRCGEATAAGDSKDPGE
jgi:hypothetical protein